ncbi:glycosyltransferase [Glaciimonas sp. PCH181]|uniref:MraY family glycosyltransferase n=1 Tax=Glaciimonas sp. PCH181 TaxID=2133943 RepID=UPI001374D599|nr:glycosyltransferase [Glaciimonas sp. PCH181]
MQKFHTTAVPRVGGLAIAIGIVFALLFLAFADPVLGKTAQLKDTFKLLLAGCPIFIAGTVEDLTKRVSVKVRLSASIISALLASWLLGVTIDGLDIWGVDALLTIAPIAIAVTAFVVAGGINAINIIDGFHGLASSAVIIMSAALGFIAWQCGDTFVTQLAILVVGAAFGFLLVNYPTGRLFVGDGGAYLLGFLVSEIAVLLLIRNPSVNAWQVLAICSYPVTEVLYSIYRRKIIRKASAGHPDCLHLHTLIYRRLVCQLLTHNHDKPWIRNASVACFVSTWIATVSLAAVWFGKTIPGAGMVVAVQVLFYMAVYSRLVRGRWGPVRSSSNLSIGPNVELP